MATYEKLRKRRREDYRYILDYRTRWFLKAGATATELSRAFALFINQCVSSSRPDEFVRPSSLHHHISDLLLYLLPGQSITRFLRADNDMYKHMNNSIYNFLYDSVVNTYLIEHCNLSPSGSKQHGVVVHSHSDYFASISFPAVAELALRVNKLGKSSVTYEIGLFEKGLAEVRAVGEFIQVFVDRSTGRPTASGMSDEMRRGLERILVAKAGANKL